MAHGPLASPRFQHERLQQAASDPLHPIKKGTPRGYPVAAIQYTLYQLGFALPKSIHDGVPDGKFGDETHGAVVQLQSRKGLGRHDGKAGPRTLSYLDAELLARPDKGGPIPGWSLGGASPAPPGPAPSTAIPPGYETLPPTLLATLRTSYDGKTAANYNLADAMGFPPGAHTPSSKSFKEVLDALKAQGRLAVIEAVAQALSALAVEQDPRDPLGLGLQAGKRGVAGLRLDVQGPGRRDRCLAKLGRLL
jgi:hypothetical protein